MYGEQQGEYVFSYLGWKGLIKEFSPTGLKGRVSCTMTGILIHSFIFC